MGVDRLLQHLSEVPPEFVGPVRNGGGGFVNHVLFWNSMRTGGSSLLPGSAVADRIAKDFGSFQVFKDAFTTQSLRLFGSGWAWLVADTKDGMSLSVTTTPNQDTPAMQEGKVPILGLDLWEHAYYVKYRNKRADYVESWWGIVDWNSVNLRYQALIMEAGSAPPKGEL